MACFFQYRAHAKIVERRKRAKYQGKYTCVFTTPTGLFFLFVCLFICFFSMDPETCESEHDVDSGEGELGSDEDALAEFLVSLSMHAYTKSNMLSYRYSKFPHTSLFNPRSFI